MNLADFLGKIDRIDELSRKNHILLIAYYLRKHRGIVEFGTDELKNSIPRVRFGSSCKVDSLGKSAFKRKKSTSFKT